MKLLQELLSVQANRDLHDLLEDLGNLKALGKFADALKQQYRGGDTRRAPTETVVKKVLQDYKIGRDSEIVDQPEPLKNYNALRRSLKSALTTADADQSWGKLPSAVVLKVDHKPIGLLALQRGDDLESTRSTFGFAWDLSGLDLPPEAQEKLSGQIKAFSSLHIDRDHSSDKPEASKHPLASSRDEVKIKRGYDKNFKDEKFSRVYRSKKEGVAVSVAEVRPFIDELTKALPGKVFIAFVLPDAKRAETRAARNAVGGPGKRTGTEYEFRSDLKDRLAKYKASKMETAEDITDFLKKVFDPSSKVMNFGGFTYSTKPTPKYLGSNNQRINKSNPTRSYYDRVGAELFSGKPVTLEFEADRKQNQYNTMYITFKLVGTELQAIKATYDAVVDGKKVTKKVEL